MATAWKPFPVFSSEFVFNMDKNDLTLLCKVVDNFGDIGFVYRLARALVELHPELKLRLVVSDLPSFSALAPEIDSSKSVQSCFGWQIFDWNADEICAKAFAENPPSVILECFQCGRPGWLEHLLFDVGVPHIVQILNIDYLTAEDYADDFHCLKSATRSPRVKKSNFMPGFTKNTGGLVLDGAFVQSRIRGLEKRKNHSLQPENFTVLVFSYERDFTPLVRALSDFQNVSGKKICALVAAGKSHGPFMRAWKAEGMSFSVEELPFLPQEKWDALLCRCDLNFVRGEDSLSRACLSGVPFVWQAYPQEGDYHLVKLQALNDRLRAFLPEDTFATYNRFTRDYNTNAEDADTLLDLLNDIPLMQDGFSAFSQCLVENGNFAAHLLEWIDALKL